MYRLLACADYKMRFVPDKGAVCCLLVWYFFHSIHSIRFWFALGKVRCTKSQFVWVAMDLPPVTRVKTNVCLSPFD